MNLITPAFCPETVSAQSSERTNTHPARPLLSLKTRSHRVQTTGCSPSAPSPGSCASNGSISRGQTFSPGSSVDSSSSDAPESSSNFRAHVWHGWRGRERGREGGRERASESERERERHGCRERDEFIPAVGKLAGESGPQHSFA